MQQARLALDPAVHKTLKYEVRGKPRIEPIDSVPNWLGIEFISVTRRVHTAAMSYPPLSTDPLVLEGNSGLQPCQNNVQILQSGSAHFNGLWRSLLNGPFICRST